MRVGMNRIHPEQTCAHNRVPHACGDEPGPMSGDGTISKVFPMRVGMNRPQKW